MNSEIDLTLFQDVLEAWRHPSLSAEVAERTNDVFHADTVLRLDGEAHRRRRRAMGSLLSQHGHRRFRDQWLIPTADSALERILQDRGEYGMARMEVLGWARQVNVQLSAALIGFDDATQPDGAARLYELVRTLSEKRPSAFDAATGELDQNAPNFREAAAARDSILTEFYRPSMEKRQAAHGKAGRAHDATSSPPSDLLSLIAAGTDPAWLDDGVATRDAVFLLLASIETSAGSLVWCLRELFLWLDKNPDDWEALVDREFLNGCVNEALRLHPVVPGFPRRAVADVCLSSGTEVPAHDMAIIRNGGASADPEHFGPDAEDFNPRRQIEPGAGRHPYGFAFGSGPHMCYGLPLVVGGSGVDGNLVHLVDLLLRNGAQPLRPEDPDQLAACRMSWVDIRDEYWVQF